MTTENFLVLGILAVAILLFISERLRVDVVAMIVLVALVLTGLVTVEEAFSGFASPAVIVVWAVFIISAGLTAEVRMSRRVYDVDLDPLVSLRIIHADSRVFRQDRNPALPFQIGRIQYALGYLLVTAEDVRLLEQTIHQRRFAMIYVRNDGNIAQIGSFH